ncbi:hypothetical protein R1flu_000502 [Riccia fluitans]|uniref:Uncharacterized protein n=1 Tax=Riccia fluitans TaxID=41844 RepID=A0ABD1Y3S8_9MARC
MNMKEGTPETDTTRAKQSCNDEHRSGVGGEWTKAQRACELETTRKAQSGASEPRSQTVERRFSELGTSSCRSPVRSPESEGNSFTSRHFTLYAGLRREFGGITWQITRPHELVGGGSLPVGNFTLHPLRAVLAQALVRLARSGSD